MTSIEKLIQQKLGSKLEEKKREVASTLLTETRNPRKVHHAVHYSLEDAGFTYKGAKNGFHLYQHPEGDEVKHKFPTVNGNHSFTHTNPAGKVMFKSPNTEDTNIAQHLEKHFSEGRGK